MDWGFLHRVLWSQLAFASLEAIVHGHYHSCDWRFGWLVLLLEPWMRVFCAQHKGAGSTSSSHINHHMVLPVLGTSTSANVLGFWMVWSSMLLNAPSQIRNLSLVERWRWSWFWIQLAQLSLGFCYWLCVGPIRQVSIGFCCFVVLLYS